LTPDQGFVVFLVTTVALLAVVILTGLRAQRRVHILCVVLMFAALGVTIVYAEKLGEEYDLESAGAITPIHLTLAKVTTIGYLLPVVTGIRATRNPAGRKLHGRLAFTLVAMTLLTTATGLAMVLRAQRIVP
jgi:hypothetical protein